MPEFRRIAPLGYLDFLALVSGSALVLTDSGGLQEETTVLGVPCVTIRENTERPITIHEGSNILAGIDKLKIRNAAFNALQKKGKPGRIPELWDGKAAQRIVGIILKENYS